MTDIVARLLDEWQRLSGHSMDRGSAEAGIASNLACEAADCISDLRTKIADLESAIEKMQQHLGTLRGTSFTSQAAERNAWEAWCIAETTLHPTRASVTVAAQQKSGEP